METLEVLSSSQEDGIERMSDRVLQQSSDDSANRYSETEWYMAVFRGYRMLNNREEQVVLFGQMRNAATEIESRKIRDLIVYRSMKLVFWFALRNTGRGVPLLDLMQEGAIGLVTAVEKYEYERGLKFATYAFQWVRQAVWRAIQDFGEERPYRIPVHFGETMAKVKKALTIFTTREGRLPTNVELYEVVKTFGGEANQKIRLRDVTKSLRYLIEGSKYSLDRKFNEDDEDSGAFAEVISDPFAKTETVIEAKRLLGEYTNALANIERAIDAFPPRTAQVLRLRFGLGEFEPMTLEEVGKRYDITRERIRQIEEKALERLATTFGVKAEQITQIVDVIDELSKIVITS